MRDLANRIGNIFIKPLLRSPLHSLISSHLLLMIVTGWKTGKIYTTPVEYRREGDTIMVFSRKNRTWWKNLQGGAPLHVRVRGQDLHGFADVFTQDIQKIDAAMRAMYPRMSQAQREQLAPNVVMIWIELRNNH